MGNEVSRVITQSNRRKVNHTENADPALKDRPVQVSRTAPISAIPVRAHPRLGRV